MLPVVSRRMRFFCRTLLVLLAAAAAAGAMQAPVSPAATPSPSPSPSPRYKLAPYGFESPRDASTVPLLRFEEKTEVQGLEMNAALARFLDSSDEEESSTHRGATLGGAPTLSEMGPYRPHVTEGLNFLGLASLLRKELANQGPLRRRNRGDETLRELLLKAASPTPTPSPSPTPRAH